MARVPKAPRMIHQRIRFALQSPENQLYNLTEPSPMFLDEFAPIWNQLSHQPVAFLGGFVSGLLRLNLTEDPVNSWLNQQTGTTASPVADSVHNGKSSGPQSISID